MGRLLAIDYGRKRCGIAVTDPLQITPGAVGTVRTCDLMDWLADYLSREEVELILLGEPRQMNGQESEFMTYIKPFVRQLEARFPHLPIKFVDERFTSVLAQRSIREAGVGRKRRQEDKGLVDAVSAVIILQTYMDAQSAPPLTMPW